MVTPGKDKTEAAFQQDEAICRQHAIAHTGYGDLSTPAPATQADAAVTPTEPSADVAYLQCMAARGDTVQMAAIPAYPSPYPYDPGPYWAGGPYPYAYPGYGLAFGGPVVHPFFFHHGFFPHGDFHHGGSFHGGFHGGGHHH
jgi:hypothetical protein